MSNIEDIADRTAAGIALAYRSGEATPVERDRMPARPHRQGQGRQHLHHRDGGARARRGTEGARRATSAARRCRRSTACRSAGRIFSTSPARRPPPARSCSAAEPAKTADLACVANAAAAGMVAIGKLNMTELAYSGIGLNPHYGTPVNPNDRETPRSPGGSSSGCGAAVAARLVPCAVGSDTGGSVRIPAAFNGVVGYKTSTGRIDATGPRAAGAQLRHDRPAGALGRGLHPARHGDARRRDHAGPPRRLSNR